MSGLIGRSSSIKNDATAIGSLSVQTSAYGKALPWVFGTARVSPNLIQYEDFTSIPHSTSTSSGGKGGAPKSSTTSYTYTAAMIMALCSGQISGVGKVWKDKNVTSLGALVLDLYTGSATQTPYPYMLTKHATRALGYRGIAYIASGAYDLGSNASIGNHSFETQTPSRITGLPDANPATVITAIMTDKEQGLGMSAANIGDLTQFSNFCLANGIWVSPAYTDQKPAYENIKTLLQIGFADCYRSNGVLNITPYSDVAASSAYGTYVPVSSAPLAITEDDILNTGKDPLRLARKSQSESFNHVQVKFSDRSDDYNDNIAESKDQADIEVFGLRSMPVVEFKEICDPTTAQKVADFLLHRSLNIRNEYEFNLPWKFVRIEPMDQLAIYYPRRGHNGTVVLITEISEDEDGLMTVKAEDYPLGTNRASTKSPPTINGYTPNFSVDPGNATVPVIFEAPLQLTNNTPQVWLAVAGGANWGGCDVWASTDNASYQKIGRMQQKSRYGTTTSAIAAGAAIDTVSSLGVDLNASAGVLNSGTQQNAQDLVTRCYVGGEYISFATAALTGVNTYNLSYLIRGAYGSDNVAHASGVPFVRLDDSIFSYSYPKEWLGKTIWIKLVSFNTFGGGQQDISAVAATTYNIVGAPLGVVQNLRMATSWSSGKNASVAWDQLGGADTYDVQIYAGQPAVLVRQFTGLKNNQYIYTPQDMKSDGGPWRSITIYVRGHAITGKVGNFASILTTNPQIGALTNVRVDGGIRTGFFKCTVPTDDDFSGVIVWLSTDPTCPAIDANKIYDGPDTFVTFSKLADGVTQLLGGATYYVRAAAYDTFGKDALTISNVITFATSANAPDVNTITESMLYATLNNRINLIDGGASLPGSVAAQVANEAAIRQNSDIANASAITTLSVRGIAAGNKCYNSEFTLNLDGWGTIQNNVEFSFYRITPNSSQAAWCVGAATAVLFQNGISNTVTEATAGDLTFLVEPGKTYEMSAYTGAHRCQVRIYCYWFDINGSALGSTYTSQASQINDFERFGGTSLDLFKRIYSIGVAPAGAVKAGLRINKQPTKATYSDSYCFFNYVMFAEAVAGQTAPSPYVAYIGLTTAVNANSVAITTEKTERLTAETALGVRIDTVTSSLANTTASVTSEAATRAAAVSALSSLVTTVQARLNTRANLVKNGGFENGLTGWIGAVSSAQVVDGVWGLYAIFAPGSGTGVVANDLRFSVEVGATYTVSGDSILQNQTSGLIYFDIEWLDSSLSILSASVKNTYSTGHSFSNDDTNRNIHQCAVVAPANSVYGRVRFVWENIAGTNVVIGCRQIKVERGGLPATPYTTERTLVSSFAATQNEVTARISADSALGSRIDTVTASLGSTNASVQTISTAQATTNGQLSAMSTIKTQVASGGRTYMAGIGVGVTNSSGIVESQILMSANKFSFIDEGSGTTTVPFQILSGVTYIKSALIPDASIGDAKIVNLDGGKINATSITASKLNVVALSAITGNLGSITSGDLYSATLHGGTGYPTNSYTWPTNGGSGYHLSASGLLLGNANTGGYFQVNAAGDLATPGFSVTNGVMTINQANVINTLNVTGEAITVPRSASSSGNTVSVSITLSQTTTVLAIGCVTQPNSSIVTMTYQSNGGSVQTAAYENPGSGQIVTIMRMLSLPAGTTTVTYYSNGGISANANIILLACKK